MRILLVTMQLGSGYLHGTERYVSSLSEALLKRGHELVHWAGDPLGLREGRSGDPAGSGDGIQELPTRGWTAVRGEPPEQLAERLGDVAPDVVHLAAAAHIGAGTVEAAQRAGAAAVVTTMDFWWTCPRGTLLREGTRICEGEPGWRTCLSCVLADHPRVALRGAGRLIAAGAPLATPLLHASVRLRGGEGDEVDRFKRRRAVLAKVLCAADALIFPSPATRDATLPSLDHDRWHEIPYGLAPEWHEDRRDSLPRPTDPAMITLGFAGSLRPHKGAHLLLEAVRRLGWTNTRIRIAGTADDAAYLRRLEADARGLFVVFEGALDPVAMRNFLRSVDVLVVPSRWPENLPFVLLEAQAAGTPVVASNVPGISQRIPHPSMLFERDSAEDLARALSAFASSPPDGQSPRVGTLDEMAQATEQVYHAALAHRRGAG